MRIITVLENDSNIKDLKGAHGLSLYIETETKKILFDLGPSTATLKNANTLSIDIADIDYVVLSHGHNDHTGALQKFLRKNKKATILASKYVFEDHIKRKHSEVVNIGVKVPKEGKNRFQFIDEDVQIGNQLHLITSVPFRKPIIGDDTLYTIRYDRLMEEDFRHEMYLVIEEEDTLCLISGCSHKGIDNIITHVESTLNRKLTHVIGGYHMSHYDPFDFHQQEFLHQLAKQWKEQSETSFYSCHCTGEKAFSELESILKDRMYQLHTGDSIII